MSAISLNVTNPYTDVSASSAYEQAKERFTSAKTHQVAKGWLMAIRMKAQIQAFFTHPVVLISLSTIALAASLAFPPVSLGVAIISVIVTVVVSQVFGFAVASTISGNLPRLTKHYSAIAKLAKEEIDQRNGWAKPQPKKVDTYKNNPFYQSNL